MNKIRLVAFLTGVLLILMGVYQIVLIAVTPNASIYTPAVLIVIGAMLILAVRRK